MSILIYFVLGILTFLLILIIIGLLLPKTVHVERTIFVAASPEEVFTHVADFENFVKWNPWSAKDPDIKQTFEGNKVTVGSKYSWKGNKKVGKGFMQITHIEVNKLVEMDLNFGSRGLAKCGFVIEPKDNGTQVTWFFDSEMGKNPLSRLVGPMMDKFIGKDYQEGLTNLAQKIEK